MHDSRTHSFNNRVSIAMIIIIKVIIMIIIIIKIMIMIMINIHLSKPFALTLANMSKVACVLVADSDHYVDDFDDDHNHHQTLILI